MMASSFLIGQLQDGGTAWACIDPDTLCTSPAIAERRFAAYLAPFLDEADARQSLLEAGARADTIAPELRRVRNRLRNG